VYDTMHMKGHIPSSGVYGRRHRASDDCKLFEQAECKYLDVMVSRKQFKGSDKTSLDVVSSSGTESGPSTNVTMIPVSHLNIHGNCSRTISSHRTLSPSLCMRWQSESLE